MDNNGATFSSQTSPNTGNPLNPLPIPPLAAETPSTTTVEAIVSTPLEPVLATTEPAHDVALAAAAPTGKVNEHSSKTGFQSNEHKLIIDDSDDHLDKSKSNFSMLTKSLLILAIILFALFLCSVAFIIANLEKLNGKYDSRGLSKINPTSVYGAYHGSSEQNIANEYFNLTHPSNNGIIVVISRKGAAIHDILIPYKDQNHNRQYRSIVVHGGEENYFGSVRFGFDDPQNSMDMVYQLPSNYPLLNAYKEEWTMSADETKPYRVRFIRDIIQIVYEFSSVNANELIMTTMVAPSVNEKIVADPTNNVYFNLRGYGNLSTHYLNLSSSDPIDVINGQRMEQDRLMQAQEVDRLTNVNNYFYRFDRAGIGKNYIATLSESEKKTQLHIFSDHAGVRIDPFGVGVNNQDVNHATTTPEMRGVRISPRQSPVYNSSSIYGPTLVVYPSQAIHTTWWSFEYDN